MPSSLDVSIGLVVLAPFLAAVLAPLLHRYLGALTGWVLAVVPASCFVVMLGLLPTVIESGAVAVRIAWAPSYGLDFTLMVDGLSLTFALVISGLGALILVYSGAYLAGHRHQGRFLSFMLLFLGSMLGVVLADNTVLLFLFWELTSLASFLLIGFDHSRQAARRAAIQTLVVTGIGGLALLIGAIVLDRVVGAWDLSAARGAGTLVAHAAYPLLLALFAAAAFTKSAQLPFHFWLPNAMEAPTPVSAYLHSAALVQGGVYLLMRMSPLLGGASAWTLLLAIVGGATLLFGGLAALRETDLKQVLAQTTLATLGLLVMLIGIGTPAAILAAMAYFVAHALYKAALFMVVGVLDHATGTRELRELGGLAGKMPVTFLAAALAGLSMFGLPLTLGFLGKEEIYRALLSGDMVAIAALVVAVLGNALLSAVALILVIRPFLGRRVETPLAPREAAFSLWVGPLLLAVCGIAAGILTAALNPLLLPAVAAIAGIPPGHGVLLAVDPMAPALWLSLVTWALAIAGFWFAETLRTALRRAWNAIGLTADKSFDWLMFGLVRLAGAATRLFYNGKLSWQVFLLFLLLAAAIFVPLVMLDGFVAWPGLPRLSIFEWLTLVTAAAGVAAVVALRTRLAAIVALGVQGAAVALIYLLFGAPDLGFTQFMVEALSVVILALVMARLDLERRDPRSLEAMLRDGALAALVGIGVAALLIAVLDQPFDPRLSTFFAEASVAIAHGHNIVNVILVDFRGLDTLGEISVVMTAGIAILALIRRFRRKDETAGARGRA